MGNSEFCFPSTSMFPSASPRGTLRVSGKQNSLFPSGPVIKCLLFKSGGGVLQEKLDGMCGSKLLTYLWPKYAISAVIFMTWPKIWYPIYHRSWHSCLNIINKGLLLMVLSIMMKKSLTNIPSTQLKTRVQTPYTIRDQNGQNQYPTRRYDQKGWRTIPFGAKHTYIPPLGWSRCGW